jgi:hypothetical protein
MDFMWEYERKDFKFRWYADLVMFLNEKGKEGWQVIWYEEERPGKFDVEITAKILFKRLKDETTRTG